MSQGNHEGEVDRAAEAQLERIKHELLRLAVEMDALILARDHAPQEQPRHRR
jgi:hypothetical protein